MTHDDNTRNRKIALLRGRKYKGISTRVASKLGVTRAAVSRVFSGKTKSRRIESEIISEMTRIERSLEKIDRDSAA